MNHKNTILVTGGAGYIGSHTIVQILRNTEFEVVSIDNFSNSFPGIFDQIEAITGKKIRNYNIDLCELRSLEEFFSRENDIAAIIHFAALKSVPESVGEPLLYYHNNINSLLNLLACCKKYEVNRFIFSSSCSVYGNINELPVNENTPWQEAESPYARTKQIGENIIEDFRKSYPLLDSVILRYFNPVGAHESGLIGELPLQTATSLIPVLTQTAIGKRDKMTVFGGELDTRDGSCIRDYIHVCDIADAHIKALNYKSDESVSSVFNLGSGNGVSVLEAIQAFEKHTEVKLNYEIGDAREGDVEAIYSDCSKSLEKLNWKPEKSLAEMLLSAWEWEKYLATEPEFTKQNKRD